MSNAWILAPIVVIDVHFYFNLPASWNNSISTSFDRIGVVLQTIWFSLYCANILVLQTCEHQYIGAANI
jgi:hypothetical protein